MNGWNIYDRFWLGLEKRERNRRVTVVGDEVVFTLYYTDVAVWNRVNGKLLIDHGGYKTRTTINTINNIINAIGARAWTAKIFGEETELVISYMGDMVSFEDGKVEIDLNAGKLIGPRDFIYRLGRYADPIKVLAGKNVVFDFNSQRTIIESGIDYSDKLVLVIHGNTIDVYECRSSSLLSFARGISDPVKLSRMLRKMDSRRFDGMRLARIFGNGKILDGYAVRYPNPGVNGGHGRRKNDRIVGNYMTFDGTKIYLLDGGPRYIVKVRDDKVESVHLFGGFAKVYGKLYPLERECEDNCDCLRIFLDSVKEGSFKIPRGLAGPIGELLMVYG